MAWNRSSNDGRANTPCSLRRTGTARPTVAVRGAIAGAVVALGVAIAAWWLWPDASAPVTEGGDGTVERRIQEVKPAAAPTNETASTTPLNLKERPPQQVGEVRDGFILLSTGKLYPVKSVITSRCESVSLESRAFTCNSDRLIGSLIQVVPGDSMLGDSESVYEDFDKDFEESLKTPILIKADDPDDIKEMKQAVIGLRKEIQERKLAGEKPSQIMIESRNQLMELGTYRDELSAQVDKLMEDNEFSEKDLDDLVKAANQMLEDRGAKPLDLPPSALLYSIRHIAKENEGGTGE